MGIGVEKVRYSESQGNNPQEIMIYKKQLEDKEYFNCLGSVITNDERCTHEIKARIPMAKETFYKKQFFYQQMRLKFNE